MLDRIAQAAEGFVTSYARVALLLARSVLAFRKIPAYLPYIVEQYLYIARRSLSLTTVSAVFIGLLLGVQIGAQYDPLLPLWLLGSFILRSVLLEMGPIVLGLVLAGRVGSGIASELGTMEVTEQIDALRTMAVDPVEHLVMPRLFAGLLAFPVLTILFDLLALLASFASSHYAVELSWAAFLKGMRHGFHVTDVYASLIKGVVFGVIVVTLGAFFGLEPKRGARGVGIATTQAVIWSSITIIVLDYVISAALLAIW